MRSKIVPIVSIISLVGILLMLNYTTPREAGVFGVLVFFTMLFSFFFGLVVEIIKLFQKILKDKKTNKISKNKTYMYATVLSFGLVIMVVTRSSNLMTLSMIILFMVLSCFLIHKRA